MKPRSKLTLAALFSAACEKHGSQILMARRCGISPAMISLYISGKTRSVKSKNARRIAACLGVSVETLMHACEVAPIIRKKIGLSMSTDKRKKPSDQNPEGTTP